MHVTNEQIMSEKNKLVPIACHRVKEVKKNLAMHLISSKEFMADVLTKNVTAGVFGHDLPIIFALARP